jgi:CMP/dCMP kinase
MIITIDGPSGTGKSTVAKKVAERLRVAHFDTGAMYRAVAWAILEHHIDLQDVQKIEKLLAHFSFQIKGQGKEKRYLVSGKDVTEAIRSDAVTSIVSAVSALRQVREAMWDIQRDFARQGDAVFEGRDMGTVVFPHAEIKIFLTARPEIRAQRRWDEICSKRPMDAKESSFEKVLADIIKRDVYDSTRPLAPLKRAADACEIDTSDLSIDEVVDAILTYKTSKMR